MLLAFCRVAAGPVLQAGGLRSSSSLRVVHLRLFLRTCGRSTAGERGLCGDCKSPCCPAGEGSLCGEWSPGSTEGEGDLCGGERSVCGKEGKEGNLCAGEGDLCGEACLGESKIPAVYPAMNTGSINKLFFRPESL